MTTKRQSTSSKLSVRLLDKLITYCEENRCGVILRFKGIEQAFTAEELQHFRLVLVWRMRANRHQDYSINSYTIPTIRKGWIVPINSKLPYTVYKSDLSCHYDNFPSMS